MSQERLADILGITFQQIQKYEKGSNRIAAGRLLDIADALDIPVVRLFEGLSRRNGETPAEAAPDDGDADLAKQLNTALTHLSDEGKAALLETARTFARQSAFRRRK